MHDDFKIKNPGVAKYDRYRKCLQSMNISFTKLGEEECEECCLYEKHTHDNEDINQCTLCKKWRVHIECARLSRKAYQEDATVEHTDDEIYLSSDMQKVIMLPRLPGVKTAVFTKRLVLFHQTFASLGNTTSINGKLTTGIVWHEAVAGRNAEDLASAYCRKFHDGKFPDYRHFVFWTDNCTAQNKNWTLYTAMVAEVNCADGPESVTFKYLEKGHTFMSADSFHAQIEKGMRPKRNLYDFDDFVNVIKEKGNAIEMEHDAFRLWENGSSQGKFTNKPPLSSVSVVKFQKGSSEMFWKTSVDKDTFQSGEFLKKKLSSRFLKGERVFQTRSEPRGIPPSKKADIMKKLTPLMPRNRIQFWETIPENNESLDLINNSC